MASGAAAFTAAQNPTLAAKVASAASKGRDVRYAFMDAFLNRRCKTMNDKSIAPQPLTAAAPRQGASHGRSGIVEHRPTRKPPVPYRLLAPSAIVEALDQYVIGQEEAKKTVAVAVYSHFKKIEKSKRDGSPIVKSNMLLIGSTGTGKTLMCSTLATILDVPFVTAEATSLAHNRYVSEEIEAILLRLVEKAGGDVNKAAHGIVFIDEIDKLRAGEGQKQNNSGESVQHALLKIMEGSQVSIGADRYIDTTNILFICGGAFVGLQEIVTQARAYKFISMVRDDTQKVLDRLNSRVKPTDLVTFGLIPGVHRTPAHRLALQGSHAQDAGADHDRAAELDLQPVPGDLSQRRRRAGHRAAHLRADRRPRVRVQERRAQPARHLRGDDDADPLRVPGPARHREGRRHLAVLRGDVRDRKSAP